MLARWLIRRFSTKRTIPYVTKGKWILPVLRSPTPPPNEGEQSSLEACGDEEPDSLKPSEIWGTRSVDGINVPKNWRQMRQLPQWKRQMFALKEKFPEGWKPAKKLDREKMEQIRSIKAGQPSINNTILGKMFQISPEAVRRILKSKWKPSEEEGLKLQQRWTRRGQRLNAKTTAPLPNSLGNSSKEAPNKRKIPQRHSSKRSSQLQAGKRLKDPGQSIF